MIAAWLCGVPGTQLPGIRSSIHAPVNCCCRCCLHESTRTKGGGASVTMVSGTFPRFFCFFSFNISSFRVAFFLLLCWHSINTLYTYYYCCVGCCIQHNAAAASGCGGRGVGITEWYQGILSCFNNNKQRSAASSSPKKVEHNRMTLYQTA